MTCLIPNSEFKCDDCGHEFTTHIFCPGKHPQKCPECGSKKLSGGTIICDVPELELIEKSEGN